MKASSYSKNMSSNLKKAGSNQRRSFVPMVVSLASGSFSWRFFVIDPVSNRFNNRRAAPAGSYYPIAGEIINPVSESKNIRPVLSDKIIPVSIVIEEKNKPWYHFILSGGII
jgi:hypothetical protein